MTSESYLIVGSLALWEGNENEVQTIGTVEFMPIRFIFGMSGSLLLAFDHGSGRDYAR